MFLNGTYIGDLKLFLKSFGKGLSGQKFPIEWAVFSSDLVLSVEK